MSIRLTPKESNKLAVKKYRAKNRELLNRKARKRDRARVREVSKAWYERHKDDPGYKEKQADKMRYWLYGITPEEYKALRKLCSSRCMICGSTDKLHVDHCHSTEKVRGLLCNNCNVGLGRFKDDKTKLANAIRYLEGCK
jgi:hypothetical protein